MASSMTLAIASSRRARTSARVRARRRSARCPVSSRCARCSSIVLQTSAVPSPFSAEAITMGGRYPVLDSWPVMWLRSSMSSRFRRTSLAPGRSALLTTKMSATSSRPALFACTASPIPGFITTTAVSAARTTSTSTWPTPTVSTITGSNPTASNNRSASGTANANPPEWPRVAIDRMNATLGLPSGAAKSSIRIRSPRIAPPVSGDEGSTASTAGECPAATRSPTRRPTSVDFPEPGAPVIPTTWATPACGFESSLTSSAAAPPRSTTVSSLPSARRSPPRAATYSSATDRVVEATNLRCLPAWRRHESFVRLVQPMPRVQALPPHRRRAAVARLGLARCHQR